MAEVIIVGNEDGDVTYAVYGPLTKAQADQLEKMLKPIATKDSEPYSYGSRSTSRADTSLIFTRKELIEFPKAGKVESGSTSTS